MDNIPIPSNKVLYSQPVFANRCQKSTPIYLKNILKMTCSVDIITSIIKRADQMIQLGCIIVEIQRSVTIGGGV